MISANAHGNQYRPPIDGARLRRWIMIYSGRLGCMASGGGLSQPCLFLHLPKCGGTSLAEALYASVPMHKRIGILDTVSTRRAAAILHHGRNDPWICHDDFEHGGQSFSLREMQILTHMAWGTHLIHGHVLYSTMYEKHFKARYRLITMMREPVARSISNFKMVVRAGIMDPNPDVWMDSICGHNQTMHFTRYLSGRSYVREEEADAISRLAIERLEKFDLVGFLDRQDDFIKRFRELMGVRLRIGHQNAGPESDPAFSSTQMERLRHMCRFDTMIYERALERLG